MANEHCKKVVFSADATTLLLEDISGGDVWMLVEGTFGGGTFKPQVSPDEGTTKIDVPSVSMTANGIKVYTVPAGFNVYGDLAGSTTPTLNIWICMVDVYRRV